MKFKISVEELVFIYFQLCTNTYMDCGCHIRTYKETLQFVVLLSNHICLRD